MNQFWIFVGIVAAIFSVVTIFLDYMGDWKKAVKISIVLVASAIAAILYQKMMEWRDSHLKSKIIGKWSDDKVLGNADVVIIFSGDNSLSDSDGNNFVNLYGHDFDRYSLEYNNRDEAIISLSEKTDGALLVYPIEIKDDSIIIRKEFKYYKQ